MPPLVAAINNINPLIHLQLWQKLFLQMV